MSHNGNDNEETMGVVDPAAVAKAAEDAWGTESKSESDGETTRKSV